MLCSVLKPWLQPSWNMWLWNPLKSQLPPPWVSPGSVSIKSDSNRSSRAGRICWQGEQMFWFVFWFGWFFFFWVGVVGVGNFFFFFSPLVLTHTSYLSEHLCLHNSRIFPIAFGLFLILQLMPQFQGSFLERIYLRLTHESWWLSIAKGQCH